MKKLWDLFDKASDKCYKEIMQGKLDDKDMERNIRTFIRDY